jgi:sugar/nucleoside kinase (ribokinase family)
MKKIGVIGAPCIDEIISPSGEMTEQQLGGILYSYAAMERLARENKYDVTFYPLTFIAEKDSELLRSFFERLSHSDFVFSPRSAEARYNRVRLVYTDEMNRTEHCISILPELLPEHINPNLIASLDGLFINMISGFDISVETIEWIRSHTDAHIHLDVHALTLGKLSERGRHFTPVENWQRWALAVDSVQLNQNEALYFPPRSSKPYVTMMQEIITDNREHSVILTRAEKGCIAYNITSNAKHLIPSRMIETIDTTGSGDVFGGVFALEKTMGKTLEEAATIANEWAGKNTLLRGVMEMVT